MEDPTSPHLPNPVFSPSKAAAHRAQTKDWALVDAWLLKIHNTSDPNSHVRVPSFERNESTLQALLTLATFNESADEQRSSIERVEKTALVALRQRSTEGEDEDEDASLQALLSRQLHDCEELNALADVCVLLNSPRADLPTLMSTTIDLTTADFEAKQLLRRVQARHEALKAEQRRLEGLMRELGQEDLKPADGLGDQTTQWVRSAKVLRAKVGEYDERLASSRGQQYSGVRLEDVARQRDELEDLRLRREEVRAQLGVFGDLPADARDARRKLEAAKDELLRVVRERDRLFEDVAKG